MQVRFRINHAETKFGEQVYITGSIPQLNNWNAKSALAFNTDASRYPQWDSVQAITLNDEQAINPIEYKYVIKQNVTRISLYEIQENVKWEQWNNRIINLRSHIGDQEVLVIDNLFNERTSQPIMQDSRFNKIITSSQTIKRTESYMPVDHSMESQNGQVDEHKNSLETIEEEEDKQSDISYDQIQPAQQKPQSQPLKSSDSLSKDIIAELKVLNQEKGTWKQKLEIVAQLVDKYKNFKNFQTEGLAILSAYLYFVNSNQIKCSENGTHFRPNNHANIAYQLYQTLDSELTTDENTFIIRSLKKNLPSFADQFTQTVPLTRIRDIAHRNDIPQDLKNDIKHRLQNKLHRCADPGDLKTCEELIQRVRSGNYSGEFRNQFEIFYVELKEFFNAMGLNHLLNQIKNMLPSESQIIQEFLNKKDSGQINENSVQVLTNLRKSLKNQLNKILGDHNQKTLYQYLQLADIEIEQFLFVKLSEILSPVQQLRSNDDVKRLIKISQVAIENMMISGFYQGELGIIQNELNTFGNLLGQNPKDNINENLRLKRLKSSVERALRLGKNFTSKIVDTFQNNVFDLGSQFGIQKHSIEVYSESFVRSHLVFQFSKSLEFIIQYIRKTLNLPPFIVISQGQSQTVHGNLKYCHNLYDLIHVQSLVQNQKLIVMLETADGTEEIPNNVIGVLLKHDLPQLSHLAIRARQSGCIFACCENDEVFNKINNQIQGAQFCKMTLANESISIEKFQGIMVKTNNPQQVDNKQELKIEAKDLTSLKEKFSDKDFDIVNDFIEANKGRDVSLLGSKSVNSLRLKDIAAQGNFYTPEQITVPMTVPQYILMRDPNVFQDYEKLINALDSSAVYMVQYHREKILPWLDNLYKQKGQDVLKLIVEQLCKQLSQLPQHSLVAVRSSSTLEDLSKMAGAGLFDSYLNINFGDTYKLSMAIIDVWMSLFTERAMISRNQYGIPTSQAQMSVLIQQQIHSEFSFIIHTQNPVNKNNNEIYIEIAVGLGETLASANQQGTPYRLTFDKRNEEVNILSFANYSIGLFADLSQANAIEKIVDYSKIEFTSDPKKLYLLGKQLGIIGLTIENAYIGQAQDIEGAIVFDDSRQPKIYVVQTRNQV